MKWNLGKKFRILRGWSYRGALGALLAITGGASAQTPPAITAPAVISQGPIGIATPAPTEPTVAEGEGAESVWSRVPWVTPLPRPGFFTIPPTGPGYYSAWDMITGKYSEKRPPQPYGPTSIMLYGFFDSDFRYLDKPDAEYQSPSDALKRMHIGDHWMLSIGGEQRIRYLDEVDSRLSTKDQTYWLSRTRVYGDLWYEDKFRVYVEFIDAQRFEGNILLPPLATDRDWGDLLNAFVDVKLMDLNDAPVYARVGRQELYYGSQRLISDLDWANTQRTFEGFKVFRHSESFDVDFFCVQPVIPPVANKFDTRDDHQTFSGAWFTYRPEKSQAIDLYYLNLDNADGLAAGQVVGTKRPTGAYNVSTVGSRYAGDYDKRWMWDFEGMYQFGSFVNQSISAGSYTTAAGYCFNNVQMSPQFWISYDWASGDHNPGTTDTHGTFNQLFPFNHYYNFLDLVGRQNIRDLQFQFVFYPTKWITAGTQYHIFHLDSAKDALYNSAGAPIRISPTGIAGTQVGDELDVFVNFHLTARQDLFIGYSKLFQGEFLRETNVLPPGTTTPSKKNGAGSPELFYVQYSLRF
jgi:hypothetical protein